MPTEEQTDTAQSLDFLDSVSAARTKLESAPVETEEPTQTEAEEAQAADPAPESPAKEPAKPADELRSVTLAKLAEAEARERELREQIKRLEEAQQQAKAPAENKPQEFDPLASLGLTTADVQALAVAKELGDDAPDEVKARVAQLKYEARLRQIEEQLKQKPEEEQAKDKPDPAFKLRVEMKQEEINGFVASGIPSDYAMLSAIAQDDPTDAQAAIEQLVATVYQTQQRWITAHEAAKMIEQNLEAEAERFDRLRGKIKPASKTTTPQQGTEREIEPLSDADTATTPDRSGSDALLAVTDFDAALEKAKSKLIG